MPTVITFDHPDGGYDHVLEADLAGRESLATTQVASPISAGGGTTERHKVAAPFGRTVAEFPDDYDDHPQAVVHYVQTLTDSHAPKIATVYGPDPLARKFAVMLGAEYGGETAPEMDTSVAAPAITEVQV
jgi:hypothetical protein